MNNSATVVTIPLSVPIERGETKIDSVNVRKPAPGELRGLSLSALLQADVDQMIRLLPRITMPGLTEAEVGVMESGFTELVNEVVGFLLPASAKPGSPTA